MTFAEFSALVRRRCFPEGEAEELVDRHEDTIKNGLIDLQFRVKCLQVNHTTVTAGEDTFFHCGATRIDAPDGNIVQKGIWVYPNDEPCKRVDYYPITWPEMDCKIDEANARCWCGTYNAPYSEYEVGDYTYYYPVGPELGDEYMNAGANKPARARQGFVALNRGSLYLFPSVQTTENVVVLWDGIKKDWDDADTSEILDMDDVRQAIENYLTGNAAMDDDDDPKRAEVYFSDNWPNAGRYQKNARDMIVRCREKNQLPQPTRYCFLCRTL